MAIRGKNKNPYDELVGFCTVNRIGAKEEMRLRGIIDRIVESKLHQPTVSICSCDSNEDYIEQHKGVTRPYCSKCDEWNSKN